MEDSLRMRGRESGGDASCDLDRLVVREPSDAMQQPGEILAVIGDNGAGKSTLIKALSGAVVPDSGEIRLDDKPVNFKTPHDARTAGI